MSHGRRSTPCFLFATACLLLATSPAIAQEQGRLPSPDELAAAEDEGTQDEATQTGEPAPAPPAQPSAQEPRRIDVVLVSSPPGVKIMRNGERIATGRAELALEPGTYEFRFQKEGYKTRIETLMLSEVSRDVMMSVNLSRTDPETVVLGRTGGLVDTLGDARRPTGWALLGVGAGLVATSVTLAVFSGVPDSCSQLEPTACQDARNLSGWATFTGVLGGAGIMSGLGLLIWESIAGEPPEAIPEHQTPSPSAP